MKKGHWLESQIQDWTSTRRSTSSSTDAPFIKLLLLMGGPNEKGHKAKGGRPIEEGPKIITENMPVRT